MTVFVTGATGFIGSRLTRALLADGCAVRALVRPGADLCNLAGLNVELVTGDLRDRASLEVGIDGCDTLYHAAADYRLWCADPAAMYETNVAGTRNIMEAALNARVAKVVYTSSVGTLGNPGNGTPGTETTPVAFTEMVGDYKKSKFLAEREAESFLHQGLPLIIVHPSTPVGPGDIKPTPTGKMIVDFLAGRMPAYLDTGLNLIDVDDCARGHILAAQRGEVGGRYILGGENLSLRAIFELLAGITGLAAPRVRLPYLPVLLAAHCSTGLARLTGKPPLIPLAGVQMARKLMYFDSSKATRELGLPQRPTREALARSVAWFRGNGSA
jgi:dihydroflavonol-4-reductase